MLQSESMELIHLLLTVSILSSTLTPTIHPTFPLRFVSYASIFPNPVVSSPNPDMVVDLISSFVGSRKPGEARLDLISFAYIPKTKNSTTHSLGLCCCHHGHSLHMRPSIIPSALYWPSQPPHQTRSGRSQDYMEERSDR